MTRPLEALVLAALCALVAGACTSVWLVRRQRSRLAFAQSDLIGFLLGLASVVSLVPEVIQAFAPELLGGFRLEAFGADKVDYAAYVFAPISIGIGLARRLQLIRLERDLAGLG